MNKKKLCQLILELSKASDLSTQLYFALKDLKENMDTKKINELIFKVTEIDEIITCQLVEIESSISYEEKSY